MYSRCLALLALLLPALVYSAAPGPNDKPAKPPAPATDLGTLVVSATRTEEAGNTTPAFLTVIRRDEIERSGATQLVDVLRGRAGVEVSDLYGDGSRPNVGLRGFGENAPSNTLVLVDGRRLNNPDIASQDFNSIPLDTVERIEIIQGSAGALYGDQAVGGVINIITRVARTPSASVEVNGGSYGQGGARARGTAAIAPGLRLSLDADAQHKDNYRAHNRLDLYSVGGRGDYDWSGGGLSLELRHEDERLQFPGALTQAQQDADRRQVQPGSETAFNNTATDLVRFSAQQALSPAWTLRAELSSRTADGEGRLSGTAFTQQRRVYGFTPRLTGRIAVWDAQSAQLTLGSDIYLSEYRLDAFGPSKNDQQTYDGYVQAVIPVVPQVGLTAAVRYGEVHNRLRDSFTFTTTQPVNDAQVAHSAGAYWYARPDLKLFLRHDRSFRYAKVDEYFGAGSAPAARDLKTQTGDSYETGVEYRNGALQVALLLYRLDLDNEIIYDPTTFTNTNLARSRRDGELLELRYPLPASLTAFGSYAHIDVRATQGALDGRSIPLTAEHQGRAGFEWAPPVKGLNTFIEAQAYSERYFSGDFANSQAPLPAYQVVNLGGSYRAANGLRAALRVNNLLNAKYSEFGVAFFGPPTSYPSPETHFQVTLGYEFSTDLP